MDHGPDSIGLDRATVTSRDVLCEVDGSVVDDARNWVYDQPGVASQVLAQVSGASHALVRRALRLPRVASLIERAAGGILERFEPVAVAGVPISADPTRLSSPEGRAAALRHGDETADRTLRSYRLGLAVQGAAAGALSVNVVAAIAAMATDVATTTLTLLSASAQILVGYGYDGDVKASAIACMLLAGEADPHRRHIGLLAATGIRPEAADPNEELLQIVAGQAGTRVLTDAVEALLRRRLHQRALATVPLVGAAAGAATSAVMAAQVCTASRHAGRLRLVHRHTGLTATVLAP